ncbi:MULTISPECIES: DUF5629 family protein [unclassified Pseudomonas]|uniref:DUF5629 family protein n=1 Tax=unclassified Pseudomonas TaxID=196821 RepID=UPI00129E7501|nr:MULTISPECIES: DUF5629 family protein [unclassified Pseudomonas]MDH4651911.1 hypothetical protein [Pseudomonas sp. BN606]MRK23987.1 hypothetical protein [Pseudomonas sp. JG-B]
MTHENLLDALLAADMLLIDDLHAWEFDLDLVLVEALQAGQPGEPEAQLLCIACMDGRTRREWRFTQAAVQSARFDSATGCWKLAGAEGDHALLCLDAVGGDAEDEDEQE